MRNRFYIPGSISARDDMPLWDLESLDQVGGVIYFPPHHYIDNVIIINRRL